MSSFALKALLCLSCLYGTTLAAAGAVEIGVDEARAGSLSFSCAWKELSPAEREVEARRMEIYSAMVEQMDAENGRILRNRADSGEPDNTLILFMSDNGPAGSRTGRVPQNAQWVAGTFDNSLANMGRPDSYISYGADWVMVSAAPHNGLKSLVAEGCLKVPAIVAGPELGIRQGRSSALLTARDVAPLCWRLRACGRRKIIPADLF